MIGLYSLGHAYLLSLAEGACPTGKRRYPTEAAAGEALRFLALRAVDSLRRREHTSYACGHCGGHHLTSNIPANNPLRSVS